MFTKYKNQVFAILLSLVLLVLGVAVASAGSAYTQPADACTFAGAPGCDDVGDSELLRNDNNVRAETTIQGAAPGVYTMWWIVWNTPEGCFNPWACNEPDLFNPNAGLAIGYAGGAIVDEDGELHITAHLGEGKTLTRFPYPELQGILALSETTLISTDHAEVHLVFRYHGEKIPGLVNDAMHTFNGACIYGGPIAGTEPAYGAPGPNACVDLYFVVFPSPAAP